MDSRRLQELREVYTQLSQQSTGPGAAVGISSPGGAGGGAVPSAGSSPLGEAAGGRVIARSDMNAGQGRGQGPFGASGQPSAGTLAHASAGGAARSVGAGASPARLLKRETSFMSASSEHDGGGTAGAGAAGKKKRKRSERNSFYPGSYFEWTDELMAKQLPESSNGSFVAAIFELGLKHSSPKVLMKLMPPKAHSLTTEHIKSRLQKYRLHAHRSKEEFLEFYNLRLQAKFDDFLQKEGWRNLPPEHGQQGLHDEAEYDSAGGGGGGGGRGGEGAAGGAGGRAAGGAALAVKIDGQMVDAIRDLGAQCVREQFQLQEVLRKHIAAQLRLQAEIHKHLTTTTAATPAIAMSGGGGSGSARSLGSHTP